MANPQFNDFRIRVSDKKIPCYKWANLTVDELKSTYEAYNFHSVVTACVMGKISEMFCIDIDCMQEYEKFKKIHYLECFSEYTYCESTRKGFHAYFKLPEQLLELQCNVSKIHPKIDIRANGGHAIIAPSRTFDDIGNEVGEVHAMNDQEIEYPRENLVKLLLGLQKPENPFEEMRELPITCPLLDLINPARYSNRNAWLQFGTCLKSCGYSVQTFCYYSAKNAKHEPCTCEIVFSSLKLLKLGKPTLATWAKMDNPVGYEEYKRVCRAERAKARTKTAETDNELEVISAGTFDYADNYTYIAFLREFSNTHYDSYEELDRLVSIRLIQVIAYISGMGAYITKARETHHMMHKLGDMEPVFTYPNHEGNIIKLSLSKYIKKKPHMFFSGIDCNITGKVDSEVFNTFQGYKAKMIDDIDSDAVEMMNTFILDVWADGDADIADYVISWLASLVQTPEITRVALVAVSEQGCGKNTLSDFMRLILGTSMVSELTGIGSLVQKHNAVAENKRLIVINEMSSTSNEFRSAFDKIKPYISDSTLTIEPKGFPAYTCTNISNLMMFTNHADSIIAEKSDRRYQVLKLSTIHMQDEAYFRELRRKCFNDHGRDSYYTFLMNHKMRNIPNIIMTPLKQELIEFSKSSSERFCEFVLSEETVGYEIKASNLHLRYQEWCKEECERNIVSRTKFGTIAGKIIKKVLKRGGTYYIIPENRHD